MKKSDDEYTTYRSWNSMRGRCLRKTDTAYNDYGGRGITICDRWMTFDNFILDMGLQPEGKTLDRINNNLGYYPENCRWADRKQQSQNRRSCVILTIDGVSKILREWSFTEGAAKEVVIRRRIKRGLDHKTAVFGIGSKNVVLPGTEIDESIRLRLSAHRAINQMLKLGYISDIKIISEIINDILSKENK